MYLAQDPDADLFGYLLPPQSNFIPNKPVYVIDTTQSNKHYKVDR